MAKKPLLNPERIKVVYSKLSDNEFLKELNDVDVREIGHFISTHKIEDLLQRQMIKYGMRKGNILTTSFLGKNSKERWFELEHIIKEDDVVVIDRFSNLLQPIVGNAKSGLKIINKWAESYNTKLIIVILRDGSKNSRLAEDAVNGRRIFIDN